MLPIQQTAVALVARTWHGQVDSRSTEENVRSAVNNYLSLLPQHNGPMEVKDAQTWALKSFKKAGIPPDMAEITILLQ